MSHYPGYYEDPKVKKIVDRCHDIYPGSDLNKKRGQGQYAFATLERSICDPETAELAKKYRRSGRSIPPIVPKYQRNRAIKTKGGKRNRSTVQQQQRVEEQQYLQQQEEQDIQAVQQLEEEQQEDDILASIQDIQGQEEQEEQWTQEEQEVQAQDQQTGGAIPILNDPLLQSYLRSTGQVLTKDTLIPLGIILTIMYSYMHPTIIQQKLDSFNKWVQKGSNVMVPFGII